MNMILGIGTIDNNEKKSQTLRIRTKESRCEIVSFIAVSGNKKIDQSVTSRGRLYMLGEGRLLEKRQFHKKELELTLERVCLPNGIEVELEMVRHPGAAAVVPFVNEHEMLLVRQYRWATGGWIYEIPAGKLLPGESPQHCAERELAEEIGQRAGKLEPLGSIWTVPGFSDERIHLFVASELTAVPKAHESDELIEVLRAPFRDVLEMALQGELCDSKSLSALLRVVLRMGPLGLWVA
jgi:ADP-ribose pyrophosphatase